MIGAAGSALGIYIAVPFCRSKCTYCNFASDVYPAANHERYVERLIKDLFGSRPWAASLGAELPRRVDTVYLGGGSPTLLSPELLARLFSALRSGFDIDPDAEITMECAPGQISGEMLAAMAAAGVNRASLGVQSFVDSEAHLSGRLHSREIVESDIHRLRAAGIANLNVDLIAGLAGQTFASWEQSLAALVTANVPHASVYMLEVDHDSRLGRELLAHGSRYGASHVPEDDAIARMYERAILCLDAAGLRQYEISNFARPGFESRHNLRYWQRRPYLGMGLDASSMLRAAQPVSGRPVSRAGSDASFVAASASSATWVLRTATTADLAAYLVGPAIAESSWLPPERQHEEAWFLGLRANSGVSIAALEHEFGRTLIQPALEIVTRLANNGLLARDGDLVRLTPRGRLLSNDVFQEFLAPEKANLR